MLIFRAAWALCRTFTMLQIKGISQLTRQRCSPCMPGAAQSTCQGSSARCDNCLTAEPYCLPAGTSTGQRDWLTTRAAPVTRAAAGVWDEAAGLLISPGSRFDPRAGLACHPGMCLRRCTT